MESQQLNVAGIEDFLKMKGGIKTIKIKQLRLESLSFI